MNDLVAESCLHCECSTIDERSRSSSRKCSGVANCTTDTVEERIATCRSRRNWILTTRSACCGHKVGEGQYVIAIILRIRNRIKRSREGDIDHAFSGTRRVLMCASIRCVRAATAETVERVGNT